jgi:hypothetical protein
MLTKFAISSGCELPLNEVLIVSEVWNEGKI